MLFLFLLKEILAEKIKSKRSNQKAKMRKSDKAPWREYLKKSQQKYRRENAIGTRPSEINSLQSLLQWKD